MNTEELRVHIKTVADTTGARQTEQSLRSIQNQVRALAAFTGLGLPNAREVAQSVAGVLGESIETLRTHERVARATAMAYGNLSGEWTRFATALEATTGFAADEILQAALSARTLSQNYGLATTQTQNLIKVSADLARVRGIGVAEAFERVQSAIRGEAEAAEYLGLTLNDTYVRNNAMNGSLRNTFERMSDAEKAQVRYNELLKQSAQFAGLAAQQTNSLDGAFARAAVSGRNLQLALGEITKPSTIAGLRALATAAQLLKTGLSRPQGQESFIEGLRDIGRLGPATVPVLAARVVQLRDAAEAERKAIADAQRTSSRLRRLNEETALQNADAFRKQEAEARRAAETTARRLRELNENLPARDTAAETARVAFLDQLDAGLRDLVLAEQNMVDLQRESIALSAEEAQIRMSLLPTQQRLAELQRQTTEAQIRAQQAALPASEALEDLRYLQQRAQLIGQNRNIDVQQRIAARQQLRAIGRGLPGAELAALEAGRGVTLAGRAGTRAGLEAQLFEIASARMLAGVTGAQGTNALAQAIVQGVVEGQRQLVQQLLDQGRGPFNLNLQITLPDGSVVSYSELLEAEQQAQGPSVVKLSGVRRS